MFRGERVWNLVIRSDLLFFGMEMKGNVHGGTDSSAHNTTVYYIRVKHRIDPMKYTSEPSLLAHARASQVPGTFVLEFTR